MLYLSHSIRAVIYLSGKHLIKIPCGDMPFVIEADYGFTAIPMIHCDRTADFSVAVYLLKGSMEVTEDGESYELTPDSLFFLKNGVHHWGEKPFKPGTAWYYAHFLCNEAGEEIPELRLSDNKKLFLPSDSKSCCLTVPKLVKMPPDGMARTLFAQLVKAHNSGNIPLASVRLWELFIEAAGLNGGKAERENSCVRKIREYLSEFCCGYVSAQDIEKSCGLSYKYAGAVFKKETGMTIRQYQLFLRMERARKLLLETDLTISDIAALTGFYDAFHFSRMFSRENGISPDSFRRSYLPKI